MLKVTSLGGNVGRKPILNGVPAFRHAERVSASIMEAAPPAEKWTLKQVQGDAKGFAVGAHELFGVSIEDSVR